MVEVLPAWISAMKRIRSPVNIHIWTSLGVLTSKLGVNCLIMRDVRTELDNS